ncbi:hypothetical protein [Paenibacillus soyae]|uniref:Secreted protein n=1 Tax=Paenibacillus soyae TaxID=2969249 RepID=A0A9X2MTZ3_9BACL|nr:hypothetical protein [Paenibacillus soyae]MCR2805818.1 hypothetical protein [Paenibacillus soyae]
MNKRVWLLLLICFLLAGCASNPSWEEEQLEETSNRLLDGDVEAFWTVNLDSPSGPSDEDATIRLDLKKTDGSPLQEFDIHHEKMLHLMVISDDLSYFNHIHPLNKGNGRFEIENRFPAGGKYRLIADFKPTGGDSMTKMEWVTLAGAPTPAEPIIPDKSLTKEADGVAVDLKIANLASDASTTLTFTLTDRSTGQSVVDLQPYLGAIGHVVVLSENGEQYVHVHANGEQGSGPEAVFETTFPGTGIYKIWAQFQRLNRVFTVSYVVDVPLEASGE